MINIRYLCWLKQDTQNFISTTVDHGQKCKINPTALRMAKFSLIILSAKGLTAMMINRFTVFHLSLLVYYRKEGFSSWKQILQLFNSLLEMGISIPLDHFPHIKKVGLRQNSNCIIYAFTKLNYIILWHIKTTNMQK